MCKNIECPWPFSVVVSPSQAEVLEVEGREAGPGGKKRKKKNLDGGVQDSSTLSLLDTSSCSEVISPETKKLSDSQMENGPEKNREVFDEDALDYEPEEEEEDVEEAVVGNSVEDEAEVSITVAELLEASDDREDVVDNRPSPC